MSTYLMHHGIKGQKWGIRRYQNEDGSYTSIGRKRHAEDARDGGDSSQHKTTTPPTKKQAKEAYNKTFKEATAKFKASKHTDKDYDEYDRVTNKAFDDYQKAKQNIKNESKKKDRESVKAYSKEYDKWEKAQNAADKHGDKVDELYKGLAKTSIGRIKAVKQAQIGKGSEAAKKYLKEYDSWEKAQNAADKQSEKVSKAYEATGKNKLSRIKNNILYS